MFGMNNKQLMWAAVGAAVLVYLWHKSNDSTTDFGVNGSSW